MITVLSKATTPLEALSAVCTSDETTIRSKSNEENRRMQQRKTPNGTEFITTSANADNIQI